jgi:hypothetical protein
MTNQSSRRVKLQRKKDNNVNDIDKRTDEIRNSNKNRFVVFHKFIEHFIEGDFNNTTYPIPLKVALEFVDISIIEFWKSYCHILVEYYDYGIYIVKMENTKKGNRVHLSTNTFDNKSYNFIYFSIGGLYFLYREINTELSKKYIEIYNSIIQNLLIDLFRKRREQKQNKLYKCPDPECKYCRKNLKKNRNESKR